MRILISNDDGIFAPGIRALVRAFADAGHEVIVAAPDSQRSAASHSLTIARAISVQETEVPGAARAYAIGGTPVDCVKLALKQLCPDAEFVVSGINHGYNAGSDALYSGTVGAAMEGALCGLPAMAVSLAHEREDTYDLAAQAALEAMALLKRQPLKPLTLLNVNYPAVDRAIGVKAAPLKALRYLDDYRAETDESGRTRYRLFGDMDETMELCDDDYSWLARGYVTLSVLGFDLTDHAATDALGSIL